MLIGWLAALCVLGGAVALYAASPHQALFASTRRWRPAGAALLVIGLGLLLTLQGPATAVFTWTTGAMLVWSTVPIAARWWRFRAEAQ